MKLNWCLVESFWFFDPARNTNSTSHKKMTSFTIFMAIFFLFLENSGLMIIFSVTSIPLKGCLEWTVAGVESCPLSLESYKMLRLKWPQDFLELSWQPNRTYRKIGSKYSEILLILNHGERINQKGSHCSFISAATNTQCHQQSKISETCFLLQEETQHYSNKP